MDFNKSGFGIEGTQDAYAALHDQDTTDTRYLWNINATEKPEALPAFEIAYRQGRTADQIAALCNEVGHLTYADENDPNALINRFEFCELSNPHIQGRMHWTSANEVSVYESGYYAPSSAAVRRTRELREKEKREEERNKLPELKTHEDYIAYFAKFPRKVLEKLFENISGIQLTKGCNGPCRGMCAVRTMTRAESHIPFETVQWIFNNFSENLRKPEAFLLYHASDIRDYKSDGKTAHDVIELYRQARGDWPTVSTVYGIDQDSVNFILGCLQREIPLYRISRLASGRKEDAPQKLLDTLKKSAEEKSIRWTSQWDIEIERACGYGDKTKYRTVLGNAVKPDTEEKDIAPMQVPCRHGVILQAGSGFSAAVLRPPSTLFPYSEILYPIMPEEEEIKFPKVRYIYEATVPFNYRQALVLGPHFISWDKGQQVFQEEKESEEEVRRLEITAYKTRIADIKESGSIAHLESFLAKIQSGELFGETAKESLEIHKDIGEMVLDILRRNQDWVRGSMQIKENSLKKYTRIDLWDAEIRRASMEEGVLLLQHLGLILDITKAWKKNISKIFGELTVKKILFIEIAQKKEAEKRAEEAIEPILKAWKELYDTVEEYTKENEELRPKNSQKRQAILKLQDNLHREYTARTGEEVPVKILGFDTA